MPQDLKPGFYGEGVDVKRIANVASAQQMAQVEENSRNFLQAQEQKIKAEFDNGLT